MSIFNFSSFAGAVSPSVSAYKTHSIWDSIKVSTEPLWSWTKEEPEQSAYPPYQLPYQSQYEPQLKSGFPLIPVVVGGFVLMVMMMVMTSK